MYIYKTTNLINGKIYIGKSSKGINESINYYGSGISLTYAIRKYGKENFKKEILCEADNDEILNNLEKYWIKKLNSQNRSIGYNIADGGTGGKTVDTPWNFGIFKKDHPELYPNSAHSENTKRKISKALKNRWAGLTYEERFGEETGKYLRECRKKHSARHWTDNKRKEMSELLKGRVFSKKSLKKMKNSAQERAKTNKGENHHCFGKKCNEETKKKLSEKAKNRPKIKCPHCGKIGATSQMKRWHFNNCKFKINN